MYLARVSYADTILLGRSRRLRNSRSHCHSVDPPPSILHTLIHLDTKTYLKIDLHFLYAFNLYVVTFPAIFWF